MKKNYEKCFLFHFILEIFTFLRECNTRTIFLEKSYTKCGGETSPRPFYKKSKLNISPD